MPGQSPQPWKLPDVVPRQSYTVEFPLDGAVIYFKWYFAALSDERTGLTQRIILEGANAATYLSVVQQSFALSLKAGMERIAASIGAAYKSRQ